MRTKLLIFGITGDLSHRKLLPALQKITRTGKYDDLEIIGVSRHDLDIRRLLQESLGSEELAGRFRGITMNLAELGEYERLKHELALKDDDQLLVYLAVPPTASTRIVDFLGEAGLNTPNVKLMFEKPFGVDLASAQDMIERTARYFSEDQIYRIDHYLAKEMAQNIVVFRGRNAMFMHLWHERAIERIEVFAAESIDIENRVDFYEQTGALRDFVQGHLLQLLALTLVDIPHDFDWSQLPKLRLDVLNSLAPANPRKAVRAQYEGYKEEVGSIRSQTETFVQLELESTDERWKDVPLILTTGKALDKKFSEVRVRFKKFDSAQSNCLVFRIQPDEGIEIELFIKKPDYAREFESRHLTFTYPPDANLPEAYEQVIVDAIESHKSLFASSGEIVRSWEVLQPLLDAWGMDDAPIQTYSKGSSIKSIISK